MEFRRLRAPTARACSTSTCRPSSSRVEDITWKLVGELGYQAFGTTSLGTQLPDYAHWRLGTVFTRGNWSLEVNYQDTNLSKESCFVLTGDTSAGGTIAAVSDTAAPPLHR